MWQLLTWQDDSGHLQPVLDQPEDAVVLQDGKGACSAIDYVPPDKPNIGLGFSLCPNGNQLPHFEATISAVKKLCRAATGAHLTELETRQLIYMEHHGHKFNVTRSTHACDRHSYQCSV